MTSIEKDIEHIDQMEDAEDITRFVIDYLKGRGARYTVDAARQLERKKNVRFFYHEDSPSLIVKFRTGASLSRRQEDVLQRHGRRIVQQWEDENGYETSMEPYQLKYLYMRALYGLPLGVMDDGTILRLHLEDNRFTQAQLKQIDRLQYFAR